ncbi:amidohydrolase family protein [Chloroflexota bacterium]
MKIDVFSHFMPPKYRAALQKLNRKGIFLAEGAPANIDLESRFQVMDKYDDLVQVLTLTGAPVEAVGNPTEAAELAKIANDEMAELVLKYPDRFAAAVATLPMNDMDAALKELDRAVNELKLRGVLIWAPLYVYDAKKGQYFPTEGRPIDMPELVPLYEKMTHYNLPIWIHPLREAILPDYSNEEKSKYHIWQLFGWPFETTVAMTRLVFSGILEKFPTLKIITHHCGAMVPYFERRISVSYDFAEMRLNRKYKHGLTKNPVEYFRMFYADTAISGSTPGLMCGYAFFGADHLLFGTDMPYDAQNGHVATRETIRSVEEMDIPESEKKKIFEDNARRLLRLPL